MRFTALVLISLAGLSCGPDPEQKNEKRAIPNYHIAYNVMVPDSGGTPNYEVFRMGLDGSDPRNLTNHPDVAWTYLAHEDRIFFISDRDTCYRCFFLYEMDGAGQQLRKITNFLLKDSWMGSRKEGRELIVTPKNDSAFYIIDRQGKQLQRIPVPLGYISDPSFSPDGEWIAFRGSRAKFKKDAGYRDEIYLMRPDGSQLRQLTHYPESDTTAQWYSYHAGPPRWHPSGDFLTYQSRQQGQYNLFAISPEGGPARRLTALPNQEGWHDWSPDGAMVVIEMFDPDMDQFHIGLWHYPDGPLDTLTGTTYRLQQAPVFFRE